MNHRVKSLIALLFVLSVLTFVGLFMNGSSLNNAITGNAVAVSCYENADCDDKIESTEDVCRNPGTEYSLCVNKPRKS